MSWPDGEHYLCPLQSPVVSLFLSLVSTLLFSWTGGILSHLNSLTHRFPQFPSSNLCSLVMLTVFFLVYVAMDTAFFLFLISLGLAESRILPAAPADTHARIPLISFCTVQLQTFCAAFWRLSVSLRPLVLTLGSCLASGALWSSTMLPSLGRGQVNNNNKKYFSQKTYYEV